MIEFINLVRWLLFVLSFISRSLGEVNAWLSLRRAHWRISASLFPMCVWGMCACMRVHWSNEPLPQNSKETHICAHMHGNFCTTRSAFSVSTSQAQHIPRNKKQPFFTCSKLKAFDLRQMFCLSSAADRHLFYFKHFSLFTSRVWTVGQHINPIMPES